MINQKLKVRNINDKALLGRKQTFKVNCEIEIVLL